MVARVSEWVRRQPVLAFFILAFVISWSGWIPQAAHSHGLFPFDSPLFYVLGGVGPMAAAFIVLRALKGAEATGELFGPLGRWRVGTAWYVIAIAGYALTWLAATGFQGQLAPELREAGLSFAALTIVLQHTAAAVGEEVAWRGFALPRLQARYGALLASLVIGAAWGLWHLPLLLTRDTIMGGYPLIPFYLQAMAISVVYAWLYNGTKGSVLIAVIFHAASNLLAGPFAGIAQAALTTLVAAALVMWSKQSVESPAWIARRMGEAR